MLRFLRSHLYGTGDVKPEDVNDFFSYSPTLRHGFPQNVTAFAVDHLLGLVAIGTRDGHILVLGAENVEWSSCTPKNVAVSHIYFSIGLGCFIVLCSDQSFHRFQLNGDIIERTTASHEERLKRITCCAMQNNGLQDARLLIGTVTGNIYALYVASLELAELVLFEDSVSHSVTLQDDARSADDIAVNPQDAFKILIVFNSLTIAYFDLAERKVVRHWNVQQPILSIAWCVEEDRFICSHKDGSLDVWSVNSEEPVEPPNIPFGPFPCTPVTKILNARAVSHPSTVKFYTGGMPRASYGDRFTLSAQRPERLVVFDFGSPVIDFALYYSLQPASDGVCRVTALLVLCEQELVCIDLKDPSWPVLEPPYLSPIHSSQITCLAHCAKVEEHIWKKLTQISDLQKKGRKKNKWPVHAGGEVKALEPCASSNVEKRQLLITGHENGMVKLWSAGSASLRHLLSVDSAKEFEGYIPREDEDDKERRGSTASSDDTESGDDFDESSEWPPFRKVGTYDPFCDDPRLAVQKVHFSPITGQLAVGGRAGHAILYNLESEALIVGSVRSVDFHLLESSKVSSGVQQRPLPSRRSLLSYSPGYQPFRNESSQNCVVQLLPATPVTSLNFLESRNLLAVGCEYGFVLCDLTSQVALVQRSMTSGEELMGLAAHTSALSRFKSMKKSIRQSFRRKKKTPQNASNHNEPENSTLIDGVHEVKPVERQVVARTEAALSVGEPLPSTIRVLKFYNTYAVSASSKTDSLWVGTNEGVILVYAITDDALKPEDVCVLVKEVHLQHRAPIIDFNCLVSEGSAFGRATSSNPRITVYTEEQIKTFSLPTMKPTKFKFKMTSVEGARIRKTACLTLRRNSHRKVSEQFVTVITNQGELYLFTAFSLKRCAKVRFTKAIDVAGIASAVISKHGELFFLRSGGSEFQRSTLTTIPHSNLVSPLKVAVSRKQRDKRKESEGDYNVRLPVSLRGSDECYFGLYAGQLR